MSDTTIERDVNCPRCGSRCDRDSADVGVGVIYGPWGCHCGWSEGPRFERGYQIDQWGGLTPTAEEGKR